MESLNLNLPLLMPSQAQKHVTHNEALVALDAIVQLAVEDRNRTSPPVSPADGTRHIVASGATGEWAGHAGEIACFLDGGWRFFVPRDGWLAWLADEAKLIVRKGGAWQSVVENFSSLGVNATADATNRLAIASAASLFSHEGGDHQLTINKANATARATLMLQSAFSGRAEIGLIGDNDLLFKVSADGNNFVEAVRVNNATGDTCLRSLNSGPLGGLRNAIINGRGTINQRGFAGGALTGYGYDRWKAEGTGCSVTVTAGRFSLTGAISQTIEKSGLPGSVVTVSVDAPSRNMTVTLGTQTGTIPSGAGRRHITLTLGSGEADDLKLTLSTSLETTFADVQVERGPWPTPFETRPAALEELLCRRYFEVAHPVFSGAVVSGNSFRAIAPYTVAKRVVPTTTVQEVEFSSNVPTTVSSYSISGLSRVTGAHVYFVSTATSSAAGVQLKVFASAEF
ncbi:DUF2793 domain-containing protein [Mesorhizobium sp. CGMCC 1.15528]|uniref:DUF2793 domain-containing protein n=1 Tax=Mesorhizobium zhangyense TaxID=1776730 RepID=A0A7C9R4V8_9HYPH|nr:DUF2793 domain-containing protein [Mesorhizobium zhangyense]NGN40201.1 DUF2793 domain-containing protein [Mesorhizobium zhangyense]